MGYYIVSLLGFTSEPPEKEPLFNSINKPFLLIQEGKYSCPGIAIIATGYPLLKLKVVIL
ncbi:hypothetical protein CDV26_05110 [Francisella halioticida]|uniref:Uncharacterized protein n=1 Tax=Francisella halioticida TaxID=549298 RepID=A0ABM6LYX8_9GAMM|nr:hypothetical protein [Francisella halioticida]ASG67848.1 hypothetical protein CDV26_05110 [Francisella halioticida]